jgi:hypothetical protein
VPDSDDTEAADTEAAIHCDRCGKRRGAVDHETCAAARDLEPPRYCGRCARRLVVQVTPSGWSARCSEHGTTSSDPAGI